jgi:hypothetical protein
MHELAAWHRRLASQVRHNRRVAKAADFKLALTRVIEPTCGPGVEFATLEDVARFIGLLKPWRQAWPHLDFAAELTLKAAQTGKRSDIEAATTQMERTLRRDGWL